MKVGDKDPKIDSDIIAMGDRMAALARGRLSLDLLASDMQVPGTGNHVDGREPMLQ